MSYNLLAYVGNAESEKITAMLDPERVIPCPSGMLAGDSFPELKGGEVVRLFDAKEWWNFRGVTSVSEWEKATGKAISYKLPAYNEVAALPPYTHLKGTRDRIEWRRTDEKAFDWLINCLPPLRFSASYVLCSEPVDHLPSGKGVYDAIFRISGPADLPPVYVRRTLSLAEFSKVLSA